MTELAFFGVDRKPVRGIDGVAKMVIAYDMRGREIQREYFDVEYRLSHDNDKNYAKLTTVYDDRGNVIEARFYNADGPTPKAILAESQTFVYNNLGRQIEHAYFDFGWAEWPCPTRAGRR